MCYIADKRVKGKARAHEKGTFFGKKEGKEVVH
jgi:hypothetical protein